MLKFAVFILSLSFSGFAVAKPEEKADMEKEHRKILEGIFDLFVHFEQETFSALRKKTKIRKGQAQFSRPSSFRWSFQDERHGEEGFYYDGATLSHYKERDNLVIHYKKQVGFFKELRSVVDMVLDPDTLLERYKVAEKKKDERALRYTLEPLAENAQIKTLTIFVPTERTYIKEVKILYADGNYSKYIFKDPLFHKIPSSAFRFKNPGSVKEKSAG